jgi:hypothetical protein
MNYLVRDELNPEEREKLKEYKSEDGLSYDE